MATITRTRGQWVAQVSGMGTLPVVSAGLLNGETLTHNWTTRDSKDTADARKQFDAVVSQLTAGNPERKVRAVLADGAEAPKGAGLQVYEFTLSDIKVRRFRNGTASYSYLLTDAQHLS